MPVQLPALESFYHEAVLNCFEAKLGVNDPEMTGYLTRLLCEFSEVAKRYKIHDELGRPIEELGAMLRASDPVHGSAASFDAERAVRRYIGDYTLFVAGICPEAIDPNRRSRSLRHPSLGELIQTGKESYRIVSLFTLCEYEQEAPLFVRLSENFERCVIGLTLIRQQLNERSSTMPLLPQK